MTKLLSLVAVLGLVAAPAFAAEEMKAEKTAKIDCASTTLNAEQKAECAKEAKKEGMEKAAPAAGETKKEEKKM